MLDWYVNCFNYLVCDVNFRSVVENCFLKGILFRDDKNILILRG